MAVDLLIKLYDPGARRPASLPEGVAEVRRAMSYEARRLTAWVEERFGPRWASECQVACSGQPCRVFLARQGAAIVGFACYDVTFRGFVGPLGVEEAVRGRGVGAALLQAVLEAMWHRGYAYAVVGAAGAVPFYAKVAGAVPIPDSTPGAYPPPLADDGGATGP